MSNFTVAVALTMLLSGCTTILSSPVLMDCAAMEVQANPGERVQGEGFSVLPPTGAHWCMQEQTDNHIFFMTHKLLGEYVSEMPTAEEQFHTVGAGVMTVKPKEVNISTQEDLREFIQQWLQQGMRMEQESGTWYALLGASSVGNFRAVASQVVKDQSIEAECVSYTLEGEYWNHPTHPGWTLVGIDEGFSCMHPHTDRLLVHVFFSERFRKGWETPELSAKWRQESQGFLHSVQFQ